MKVKYSEQPSLFMRIVCWLSLRSPDDVLAYYNHVTGTIWIRSTLSPEGKEYALQHEIGHSKYMDWKNLCLYMLTSIGPFIAVWVVLRLMGLLLWGSLVLLIGILTAPIRLKYIAPRFKRASEDFADEYAMAQVKKS